MNSTLNGQASNKTVAAPPQHPVGYVNCDSADLFVTNNVFPLIYSSGAILNILSTIVFGSINYCSNRQHGTSKNMFEILFFKSLNDSLLFLSNIFSPLYFCETCDSRYALVMQVWFIVFNFYFTLMFELFSTYLEILATFDRFLTINPSLKERFAILGYKHLNRFFMAILLIWSAVFYVYKILEYKIASSSVNGTVRYEIQLSDFTKTNLDKFFKYAHVIVRDIMGIIMLFAFNVLIMKTMKKQIENKKKIVKNSHDASLANAEKRATQMVVMTNILFIFGHTPICLYYFQIDYLNNITCFFNFCRANLFASYSLGFFLYVSYNNIFRYEFLKVLRIRRGPYQRSVVASKSQPTNTNFQND